MTRTTAPAADPGHAPPADLPPPGAAGPATDAAAPPPDAGAVPADDGPRSHTTRPDSPVPRPPAPVRDGDGGAAAPLSANQRARVEAHQGLVRSLALQIARSLPVGVDLDDLVGYGQVGLIQAARGFNPRANVKFATFAYYRVRGAIYDGVGQMVWFRGPRSAAARRDRAAGEALRERAEADGGACGDGDVVAGLASAGRSLAAVFLLSQAGPAGGAGPASGEYGGADPEAGPADAAGAAEVFARLRDLVDELPPDAAALIRGVYFEGLSLKDAGARVGISRGWASRLHAKVLDRLGRDLRRAGL